MRQKKAMVDTLAEVTNAYQRGRELLQASEFSGSGTEIVRRIERLVRQLNNELGAALAGVREAFQVEMATGRPRKVPMVTEVCYQHERGIPVSQIAKQHGVSRMTIYRILKEKYEYGEPDDL